MDPKFRREWREQLAPMVYRAHRPCCLASRTRRPGVRCTCPFETYVPDETRAGRVRPARIEAPAAARLFDSSDPGGLRLLLGAVKAEMKSLADPAVEAWLDDPRSGGGADGSFSDEVGCRLGHLAMLAMALERAVKTNVVIAKLAASLLSRHLALRPHEVKTLRWGDLDRRERLGG